MAAPAAAGFGAEFAAGAGASIGSGLGGWVSGKILGEDKPKPYWEEDPAVLGSWQARYNKTAYPGTNPWEQLGSPAASTNMGVAADRANTAREQLKTQKDIARIQAGAQVQSAGIAAQAQLGAAKTPYDDPRSQALREAHTREADANTLAKQSEIPLNTAKTILVGKQAVLTILEGQHTTAKIATEGARKANLEQATTTAEQLAGVHEANKGYLEEKATTEETQRAVNEAVVALNGALQGKVEDETALLKFDIAFKKLLQEHFPEMVENEVIRGKFSNVWAALWHTTEAHGYDGDKWALPAGAVIGGTSFNMSGAAAGGAITGAAGWALFKRLFGWLGTTPSGAPKPRLKNPDAKGDFFKLPQRPGQKRPSQSKVLQEKGKQGSFWDWADMERAQKILDDWRAGKMPDGRPRPGWENKARKTSGQ